MSKTTDLLERMTPAEYHEEDPALAHGAKKVLGYGLLEEIDQRLKLRAALDELGVSPFTDESVERYKQMVLAEAKRQTRKGRVLAALSGVGALVAITFFGPAI